MCTGLDLWCWITGMLDAIGRLFSWVLSTAFAGFMTVIDFIPLGFDAASLEAAVNAMPDEFKWAVSAFEIDVGLGMMMSAVIWRFVIRRIPLIN